MMKGLEMEKEGGRRVRDTDRWDHSREGGTPWKRLQVGFKGGGKSYEA